MSGYQQHFDSSTIRSSADFFKVSQLNIALNIIMSSKDALTDGNAIPLFSWGARIESWDAFIGIYYRLDKDYTKKRSDFISDLENINHYSKDMEVKLKVKRIYDEWFSMICTRLARFKIFPPLPVGYAQGIGELQAEE